MDPFILLTGLCVSLGFNLILFIYVLVLKRKKTSDITFDEALFILSNVIDVHRKKFFKGLMGLRAKYAVLGNDGKLRKPNDLIKDYAAKKKELKTTLIKKIFREISKDLRRKLLEYYSEGGLINFVSTELDKENDIGGLNKIN